MKFLAASIFALLLSACAYPSWTLSSSDLTSLSSGQQCEALEATFVDSAKVPSTALFAGLRIGGLSGIDFDPQHNEYLLISDGRGVDGAGQLYRASVDHDATEKLALTVFQALALKQGDGQSFAGEGELGLSIDAEAIRISKNRDIIWTSEGDAKRGQGPGLFRAKTDTGFSQPIALPSMFMRDPKMERGPRDNRSIEGLWINPANADIWLGLESPLIEDGPVPSPTKGALTSLIRLDKAGHFQAEFRYPLDPIVSQLPQRFADNGLSEILGLGGDTMLVLERSGSQQEDKSFRYFSRIYCAWPTSENSSTTADQPAQRILHKRLVVDLSQLGKFDRANFEGMAFGPNLPDGRHTLVLISDNNFDLEDPTVLAFLAIAGMPAK